MAKTLSKQDWQILLKRIESGQCTPFLGAGACHGVLPLGADIAKQWAHEYGYPAADDSDLVKVAQFLAVQFDGAFPKEEIASVLKKDGRVPDFADPAEPHGVLARLPLPVYMTTNYDHFMFQALEHAKKDPQRDLCLWNEQLKDVTSVLKKEDYFPSPAQPVVFHLHGDLDYTDSLVVTEDDYLDFLVNIWKNRTLIPARIQKAMTGSSLLFVGYGLSDWTFRVLFRGLVNATESGGRRVSVTVQLSQEQQDVEYRDYLVKYFDKINLKVYWGTAREFMKDLSDRWSDFTQGKNGNDQR